MDDMKREERRKHPRVRPASNAQVELRSDELQSTAELHNLAIRLLDLSPKGACVVTSGRLREGLPVKLDVSIPGSASRLSVNAEVRWSTSIGAEAGAEHVAHVAGLRFRGVREAKGKAFETVEPREGSRKKDPRRRSRRFAPRDVEVDCIPAGFMTWLGLAGNAARGVRDLSQGGLQIVSEKPIEAGRRVALKLSFRRPPATIEAEGRVRWCTRDTMSVKKRWYVGIAFGRLSEKSSMDLDRVERHFTDLGRSY
jgi:Tfp pilus assembly protein PilZ